MADYDLVAGDGASAITITILDTLSKTPINLTGKTAQLRWSLNSGITVEKSMTVLDQVQFTGQVQYQFLAVDLPVGGSFQGEVRLQDGLTDQLTTVDDFHLAVKNALP